MSILYERFFTKLKIIADLTGQRITADTVKALWERLGEKTDVRDFEQAAEAMANADVKVTLGALNQHIGKYQTKRLEEEIRLEKYREEREVREWFESHKGSRDRCVNLSADGSALCYSCKRTYCNIVGSAACEAIKRMLAGKINPTVIHRDLAARFKGLGFENSVPDKQAF